MTDWFDDRFVRSFDCLVHCSFYGCLSLSRMELFDRIDLFCCRCNSGLVIAAGDVDRTVPLDDDRSIRSVVVMMLVYPLFRRLVDSRTTAVGCH